VVWLLRAASIACLATIPLVGFVVRPPMPWSAVLFYGLIGTASVPFWFALPAAVEERARRREARAEILRELEIRDGVEPRA
jgi:hypothetical protein